MNQELSKRTRIPVDFDPFGVSEIQRVVPTTDPQLEIWVSCAMGGEDASRSYNESVSLHLTGSFDLGAMRQAIREVIVRHEALRSSFSADGKQLCIYKDLPLPVFFEDISGRSPEQKRSFTNQYAIDNARATFDLIKGPLCRFALLKLSDREHLLKITAHHIICDGWSLGILLQDLGKLYSAYSKKESPCLPAAAKFSQYALDQQAFIKTETYEKTLRYWVRQYMGEVPVLNLPTDFPRPLARTYKSRRTDYAIDRELADRVQSTGGRAGCSFVTTLLAAFEIYLCKRTGQSEVVLGLPAAGQASSANHALMGHCVHLLPLRTSIDGELSFLDYLKKRKKELLDDYDHQQFSFGSLLRQLKMVRDPSRVPLVPVVFNIDRGLDDGVQFEGLKYDLDYVPREYENFEVFLNVGGSEEQLVFEWSYNTQLFRPATIDQMMEEFRSLLESVVTEPLNRINTIASKQLDKTPAQHGNGDEVSAQISRPLLLPDLFFETAGHFGQRTALRFGDQAFTYRELNELSNQLASFLTQQEPIGPGKTVSLAVDRSAEMVVLLLAILKTGTAYLPIDPHFPQKRIEFMLLDSSATCLVTSKKYQGRFGGVAKEWLIEDIWPRLPNYSKENFLAEIAGNDLAYILYTSGTTGTPKGVQVEHHSLVNFLHSMQKKPGLAPSDSLLAVTTISFDIAALELFLPLTCGAELILSDAATAKDGKLLLDVLENQQISVMQATPSTWKMLLAAGWNQRLPLKALCGGEALLPDLANKLLARCASLWNLYGPTETTIWSAVKQIRPEDGTITIGKPIDHTRIYILDENLRPLATGCVGEIYIGGDGVARGYLNRPELTGKKFVDDPFHGASPGQKIYQTGDLGKLLENGEIQCLGRIDHQVKIHGYRIEPGEIEQALLEQSGIRETVVIAAQGSLVAYIVPEDPVGHFASPVSNQRAIWKQGIRELLPEYMIPKDFILLEKLPLAPNGKIDRNALPGTARATPADFKKEEGPRTKHERLIAEIWKELLGLPNIGVGENFFELGGHSLVAVQAMTDLEKATGKRLPLASLFEAPTVEKLARLLDLSLSPNPLDSLVAIRPKGNKTPLYIVHGFGMNVLLFNNLARSMDPQQPVYALQARGLNGEDPDEPMDSMESIAGHYVQEILAQNPDGPYALAGYSLGGIIAFEMARQLRELGKDIKMLAMFDTYADNSNYFNPFLLNVTKKFRRQLPKFIFILRSFASQPWDTMAYQLNFVKGRLRKLMVRDQKTNDGPSYSQKLQAKYEYAYVHYKLTPYDGQIDLFKVKTRLYYLDDMIYLGWKEFATHGVNVYEITGDHKTFLYPPHDKEFARILQRVLDERASSQKNADPTMPILKVV